MAAEPDVVDALLDVDAGDEIELAAEGYSWSSPFEVGAVREERFDAPDGDSWRARQLVLRPGDARGSDRTLVAIEGLDAPDVGSGYGRLIDVETTDTNGGGLPEAPPGDLERHAPEIVETNPGSQIRDAGLAKILREVERCDTVIDLRQRLSVTTLNTVKDLCWELGLTDDRVTLDPDPEWLEELRETYGLEGGGTDA